MARLDVLIDNDAENAGRVLDAIRDFFGGADLGLSVADLTEPGRLVQLGVSPARIDILTSLPSVPAFGRTSQNQDARPMPKASFESRMNVSPFPRPTALPWYWRSTTRSHTLELDQRMPY